MATFIAEHLLEILFGLLSAGALAFCKNLHSKNKELIKMQEADKNRQYRQMIVDEIEPIVEELSRLKNDIVSLENNTKLSVSNIENHA